MGAKPMKCLSSSSPTHTPKEEYITGQSEKQKEIVSNHTEQPQSLKANEDVMKFSTNEPTPGPEHAGTGDGSSWEEHLYAQQEQLEREMQETRKMVSRLQALLLQGSLPEDDQTSAAPLFGDSAVSGDQQLIIIRSRLDQSMEESLDLKRELLRYKQEARNLQAVKEALQYRMSVQEDSVLQLKQELLRSSMDKDELEGQNAELQRKLNDRDRLLSEYKKDLAQKDRQLQQQQAKVEESVCKFTESSHHRLSSCENNGYSHMTDTSSVFSHRMSDELQLVRDALRSLRNSFSGHDPQHHTLDTLEQGVSSLIDHLHTSDSKKRQIKKDATKSPCRKATHTDRESWPPSSKMPHSHSSPVISAATSTKVLYFTDRSLTPFLIHIPKRLGEVTLQDFKAAVGRHNNFRYHFKSLDPEFGTVKEEVFQDDAIIPGWEGKIVAWVEEDANESR